MVQNQRDFKLLFPTVIQMTMISDHGELNTQLKREADELRRTTPNSRPASWSGDLYTTIGSNYLLHQHPGFRRLHVLFIENAKRYGHTLNYPMDTYDVSVDMCWLNAYRRSQSQERGDVGLGGGHAQRLVFVHGDGSVGMGPDRHHVRRRE